MLKLLQPTGDSKCGVQHQQIALAKKNTERRRVCGDNCIFKRGNRMIKTRRFLLTAALKEASLFAGALLETLLKVETARQTRQTQFAIHSPQREAFSGETAGGWMGGFRRSSPPNSPTWLAHGMAASDCLAFVAEINDIHDDVLSLRIEAKTRQRPPLALAKRLNTALKSEGKWRDVMQRCAHNQKTTPIHKMVSHQLIKQPNWDWDKFVTVPVVN